MRRHLEDGTTVKEMLKYDIIRFVANRGARQQP